MTQKERMKAGLIYDPMDKETMSDQAQRLEPMQEIRPVHMRMKSVRNY